MYSSIKNLHEDLKAKKTSAKEVVQSYIKKIESSDDKLNCFITKDFDNALKRAELSDKKIANGEELGLLEAAPFSIKDMFCTEGVRTTAGSRMLENFIPPYSSTVNNKLDAQGAIMLGKVNQDEFAMGSSNETSFFGPSFNPWDLSKVPGGSSGASAASVAARMSLCSMGTDTGGSIRQPAHFCGTVGLKPTYGRISRYGVVAFASSLDQAGPLTLTVEDAFRVVQSISGKDKMDNTSSDKSVPDWVSEAKNFNGSLKGKTVGFIKEYAEAKIDPEIQEAFDQSLKVLKDAGATVKEVSLPLIKHGVSVYYLVATSEAASNLSRYDGVRYGFRAEVKDPTKGMSLDDFYAETRSQGFGEEVKRRILLGNFSLSSGYYDAYYNKSCQVRRMIKDQYDQAFKEVDFILSPVSATQAFGINERVQDPLKMFLNDFFTVSVNLAGLPGISVPVMKASNGLPAGVQLIANRYDESNLLEGALTLENAFEFYKEVPSV